MDFNSIPANLRVPGANVEITNAQALQGLQPMPCTLLVFGQILAGASATPNEPVLVPSSASPDALFGRGSMLSQMCKAIKKANPWTPLYAMPLQDSNAGTAAGCSITVDSAATGNGTQPLYINGTLIQTGITAGMTAAQIATAMQAAIAAVQADLGITAVVDGETATKIDLTCVHKGADVGNTMDVRALYYDSDAMAPGVTLTITDFTGGAGNPPLTAALANLGDQWFTDWIMPYTDGASLTAIDNAVETLWGGMKMKDARVWNSMVGTVGTLATWGDGNNEKLMSAMGVQNPPQPAWLWAAVYGAQGAYYLNLDPGRPLRTIPLTGILAPAVADRFVDTDRNTLLYDGIATYTVDAGGNVLIERSITTYRSNASGDSDPSYLDAQTLATLAYMRYTLRTRIDQKYPRYKLADDGTVTDPGSAVVTPSDVASEAIALASEWQAAGLLEDIATFKQALITQRDPADVNTVDQLLAPNIVNMFLNYKGQIAFIL